VPFVWGFNAKWLATFLGLPDVNNRLFATATAVLVTGVSCGLGGWFRTATLLPEVRACSRIGVNSMRLPLPSLLEEAQDRLNHSFGARRSIDRGVVDRTVGPLGVEVLRDESSAFTVDRICQRSCCGIRFAFSN
jgi:hypothetical protein